MRIVLSLCLVILIEAKADMHWLLWEHSGEAQLGGFKELKLVIILSLHFFCFFANPFAYFVSPNPHKPMRYEVNVTILIFMTGELNFRAQLKKKYKLELSDSKTSDLIALF